MNRIFKQQLPVRRIAVLVTLLNLLPHLLSVNGLAEEFESKFIDTNFQAPALEAGFVWLFDGHSFDHDWEGDKTWFRVEDHAIVAGTLEKPIPKNQFLCTRERFQDFELRLDVKLRGEGQNAGVQFRTERIPNHHEVRGYQADVGNAFKRSVWGALYDESRRNKMLAEGPSEKVVAWTKPSDWNSLWVKAQGPRIQIWLNHNLTVDYTEMDDTIARDGIIGLQIHSGPPAEALYRQIRIQRLSEPL